MRPRFFVLGNIMFGITGAYTCSEDSLLLVDITIHGKNSSQTVGMLYNIDWALENAGDHRSNNFAFLESSALEILKSFHFMTRFILEAEDVMMLVNDLDYSRRNGGLSRGFTCKTSDIPLDSVESLYEWIKELNATDSDG